MSQGVGALESNIRSVEQAMKTGTAVTEKRHFKRCIFLVVPLLWNVPNIYEYESIQAADDLNTVSSLY